MKRAEAKAKRTEAEVKRAEAKAKRAVLTKLEELFDEGLITEKVFEAKAGPLRKALANQ